MPLLLPFMKREQAKCFFVSFAHSSENSSLAPKVEDSIQQLKSGLEKIQLQVTLAGSILHFHAQLMDLCNRFTTY